jgi:hypothetical protein
MSENTTWSVSDTEWIPLGFAEYMVRHLALHRREGPEEGARSRR